MLAIPLDIVQRTVYMTMEMTAYYNEIDPNAAGWLRELIRRGCLPAGEVDERSIVEVRGTDLVGFDQCHFFAGIGGWPHALELANWRGPVWTGSCPCQPFSAAGKRRGVEDERHLWPEFRRLIAECGPPVVFGEQVASKDGRLWLAGVRADLEALGYAVGAADLCAAGVGAPHIRQRLFWVGHTDRQPGELHARELPAAEAREHGSWQSVDGDLPQRFEYASAGMGSGGLGDPDTDRRRAPGRGLADTEERDPQPHGGLGDAGEQVGRTGQPWEDSVWLPCLDGKARRVEPGSFPLAHGVPARVGRLRGYGNAIVPQVAAEFVGAYMDG